MGVLLPDYGLGTLCGVQQGLLVAQDATFDGVADSAQAELSIELDGLMPRLIRQLTLAINLKIKHFIMCLHDVCIVSNDRVFLS